MAQIDDIKLLVIGDKQDASQDELLTLLITQSETQMRLFLKRAMRRNGITVEVKNPPEPIAIPNDLSWIITEVVVKRYNRIGSEGMAAESVEGHSVTFSSDDFAEYIGLIDDYYAPDENIGGYRPGRVVIY